MSVYLSIFFYLMLSSFIQTGIGFGLPIIAMILLVHLFPYNSAIAVCQAIALSNTLYLTIKNRKSIDYPLIMPILIPSVIIGIFTTLYAFVIKTETLEKFLGVLFILIALYFLFNKKNTAFARNKVTAWAIGLLNGVLNGFFGIGGPPTVLYVLPNSSSRESYIGTISFYFTVCNVVNLALRIYMKAFNGVDLLVIPIGWVGVFLGIFIADLVFKKLKTEVLKKLVYIFVLVNGIYMLIK